MRVLDLGHNQAIVIGDDIRVVIKGRRSSVGQIVIAVDAPSTMRILRGELADRDPPSRS